MPAKIKVSREDIVSAAVELVRRESSAALSARSVAAELKCSTQPIFSNFPNMEGLYTAVIAAAWELYIGRTSADMNSGRYPPYKASGMSYIRFAVDEPNLFRLLFMRDRIADGDADMITYPEEVMQAIMQYTGMSEEAARHFHYEMWVFVHGLAVMYVTGFSKYDEESVSGMVSDIYQGLLKEYISKGEIKNGRDRDKRADEAL